MDAFVTSGTYIISLARPTYYLQALDIYRLTGKQVAALLLYPHTRYRMLTGVRRHLHNTSHENRHEVLNTVQLQTPARQHAVLSVVSTGPVFFNRGK